MNVKTQILKLLFLTLLSSPEGGGSAPAPSGGDSGGGGSPGGSSDGGSPSSAPSGGSGSPAPSSGESHSTAKSLFGGGGSESGQPAQGGQAQPQPGQGQQPGQPAQGVVPPVQLSPEQFQALIRQQQGGQPQGQQQQQPPPRPELKPGTPEYNKMFNVAEITEDTYRSILGVDPEPQQVQALQGFKQAIVREAVTYAAAYAQNVINEVRQQYAPIQSEFERVQHARLEKAFFAENKDLEPHKDLVVLVAKELGKDPRAFAGKTQKEIFAAVAAETRRVTKTFAPQPGQPAPQGGQQQRQPAGMSMGGGISPGQPPAGGGKQRVNPTAKKLFG